MKWNGWGYKDSILIAQDGQLNISGGRYELPETCISEDVREFLIKTLKLDVYAGLGPVQSQSLPNKYAEPVINNDYLKEVKKLGISFSLEGEDRLFRGHGHTLHDLMTLREGSFDRIPDLVAWPSCHDDVVQLVQLASKLNVVLVPFGGGTNVTRALECSVDEKRMIVSLDTSQMAGIIGQDLERELKKIGLTTGHEPDSLEFSTLGGWVATRASGMKKNQYGNIEDLVVHVKFVTPSGVLEKANLAPRVSCGPDLHHLALGSEGTLGVITEVTFKVRPIPEVREFDSFVFPTFQHGVDFMREVALKRYQPASLRLIDNEQFKMGQIYKEKLTWFGSIIDSIKMMYVTKYKGIDLDSMCVAIAVFEGDQEDVNISKIKITRIAAQFEGFSAGSRNGERGYALTFTIAYVRDYSLTHSILAESFETSVPWDRTALLCRNVKHIISIKCKEFGIQHFLASCRVTQVYDTGSCVYFYLAFNSEGLENAVDTYEAIETAARDEILRCGGSLSHHHGVGKLRSNWYPSQVSPVGVAVYRAVKQALDPNNVFACGNLLPRNLPDDVVVQANMNNSSISNSIRNVAR
ncbi:hypothetical protein B566_EDAN004770 [Ephemera danica]|nr:hypothetical protein B566_EDAN004770 [Ephemera danica]